MEEAGRFSAERLRRRNLFLFLVIAVDWFALDFCSKGWANDHGLGEVFAGPFLGLFDCCLVHNTGGAFGAFEGSTLVLGALSIAVCAVVLLYLVKIGPCSSIPMVVGLSLVFAGGLGNAVDRFSYGYVIDFIDLLFIDFPVFNVADIGVTCGIVIVFLTFLLEGKKQADDRLAEEAVRMAVGGEVTASAPKERASLPVLPKQQRRVITPPELEDEDEDEVR